MGTLLTFVGVVILICAYFWLVCSIASLAEERGYGYWLVWCIGIFVSPLLSGLTLFLPDRRSHGAPTGTGPDLDRV